MQHVNGVPVHSQDPNDDYVGLDQEPTWFSAQGGVYRCHERNHPFTHVAIKKYLVEESPKYPDLFVMPKVLVENEIYTMTQCVHPNILKLKHIYLWKEFVYLVMPYCTGGSLQHYVFDHHLTVGQLVTIVQSIASGLAEIHRHGYIHRDIKCDNIFLHKETNDIVIGDFGVVSIVPAADSNEEEAGVVLFWSPELVQRKVVTYKVDIWALGIVILEVLCGGKAPYEDERLEEEEIKERILRNGRPEYPQGLPSRLVDLLDRCLEPDPRHRASANDILQHPFLRDYTPEPLFPGNPINREGLSQQDSEEEEEKEEEQVVPEYNDDDDDVEDNMSDRLQNVSESTDDVISSLPLSPQPSTAVSKTQSTSLVVNDDHQLADTTSIKTEKEPVSAPLPRSVRHPCRLPQPAFVMEGNENISTQEKIENVLKRWQSMSDAFRSQGSRLPILVMTDKRVTEHDKEFGKKVRRAASVRLEKTALEKTPPMSRSKTSTLHYSSKRQQQKPKLPSATASRIGSLATARTPLVAGDKAKAVPPAIPPAVSTPPRTRTGTLRPPKESSSVRPKAIATQVASRQEAPRKRQSVYRRKCPPGESRTARLMMGISTTGRQRGSVLAKQTSEEQAVPSRFDKTLKSTQAEKKRPVSFTGSRPPLSPVHEKRQHNPILHPQYTRTTPLPQTDPKPRRISVQAPTSLRSASKQTNAKENDAAASKPPRPPSSRQDAIKIAPKHASVPKSEPFKDSTVVRVH